MIRAFLMVVGLPLVLAFGPLLSGVDQARAGEREDLYSAQTCLDETARMGYPRHHEALRCLRGIKGYRSHYAYLLKCGIISYYSGFDLFQFPWVMEKPRTYPLVATLNYLSDVDLDEELSAMARRSCASTGTGIVFFAMLGEFYWLRFSLSKVSTLRDPDVIAALATVEDDVLIAQIDESLRRIIFDCNQSRDSLLPKSLFCQEVFRIDSAPGWRPFDKLLHRMRAYETEPDNSKTLRATTQDKDAAIRCLSSAGQTHLLAFSQACLE